MIPTMLDHLLVVVLVVALPLEGYFEFRELMEGLRRGDPKARSRTLVRTIVLQWGLVAALVAGWQAAGRPWADLGSVVPGGAGPIIGSIAVTLSILMMSMQHRTVSRLSSERRQRLIARTGDSLKLLPTTGGERRLFAATSITAGICEELLFRGFMFWYLGHWMGPWVAVLVASVPFGAAHLYQGPKGAVRTGIGALVLGSLYVATGSLLWPMIVHAVIDLGAGAMGKLLAPGGASSPSGQARGAPA